MGDLTIVSLINSFVTYIQNIAISLGFFKLHPPHWLKLTVDLIIHFVTTIFDYYNTLTQLDQSTKLVANCIIFPFAILFLGQFFMGGMGIIKGIWFIIGGFAFGLGIIDLVLSKGILIICLGAGATIIVTGVYLKLFGCHLSEEHIGFEHLPRSCFLGFLHIILGGMFLTSGVLFCGIIKKFYYLKEEFFPTGAIIHFIIAAFFFVYGILRMTKCGANTITKIKYFLRVNIMKVIFIILNAIYLPIFQTILNSMMTIKDVCPEGTNPYSYYGIAYFSKYFSCIEVENISQSNNEKRFRFNLATTAKDWYISMAGPLLFCIIFNTIFYPLLVYFIIKFMHNEVGEKIHTYSNAGASLYNDYCIKFRYWPLANLFYKLVIATIRIITNYYVPKLMLLLSFIYLGYGVLIFFLKPFENKFNNWIEIANNGLSLIFSFLPVAASFGANVPQIVMTIMSTVETAISIVISIVAFILDRRSSKNEKKASKWDELNANEVMEIIILKYLIVYMYFGALAAGLFFGSKLFPRRKIGRNDLDLIPTNTCVFLEYQTDMDFLDTNNCLHLSDIKDSIEYLYYILK
ncbi:hypothetical protein TVAG_146430 [Trichomonas vaginalis G3]|uniref:Uncharacterized protein n=1 Tax=Trichomonas vaginalis (strain ATCC PRA-98 / G3) TaxID=412133 RepID=A2DKU7_TRIV3|nr:hypothetical protein TVAGG3_0361300 [Trichomonas vaginalis G3]EAY18900.1 hypothetical protein TVAG_146430 [Trichomonas vaginalis G3]KAI5531955.1 hypothetical protein TVAGG3_0361300 [Trichomonas vaginalis G3]|eukprot:XP_001579886.1 hypothetical protein [Trichomonas vaginalis G3]